MRHEPANPLSTVRLEFLDHEEFGGDLKKPIGENLSVAERIGKTLFAASDEGAAIERLVTRDGAVYREHEHFRLADFFDLPDGPDGEADIEGLSADGGYLWVVGSHSLKRSKPDPDEHDTDECLKRLTEVEREANRYLLARIPMVEVEEGVFELAAKDGKRRAACLRMGRKRNELAHKLRKDEHIGRFLEVPAKENGFDVEGLAVRGDNVFLGLRGPVLRGWACILELKIKAKPRRLCLAPVDEDEGVYRKHFLDLDGLGIRELTFDGNDLLILAGPTMDLNGPVRVHRWKGALDAGDAMLVPSDDLSVVLHVPFGDGYDHAEGICRVDRPNATPLLLVAYDSPAKARLHDGGKTVEADLFDLPRPGGIVASLKTIIA